MDHVSNSTFFLLIDYYLNVKGPKLHYIKNPRDKETMLSVYFLKLNVSNIIKQINNN